MLTKLKHILSTYSDDELNDMSLWINSKDEIIAIFIDSNSINLITDDVDVTINGDITYEKN